MISINFKTYVVTNAVILLTDPKNPKNSGVNSMPFTDKVLAQTYMDNSIKMIEEAIHVKLEKDNEGNILFVNDQVYIKIELSAIDTLLTRETIEK